MNRFCIGFLIANMSAYLSSLPVLAADMPTFVLPTPPLPSMTLPSKGETVNPQSSDRTLGHLSPQTKEEEDMMDIIFFCQELHTKQSANFTIKHDNKADLDIGSDSVLNLRNGQVLIIAKHSSLIVADEIKLLVAAGTIALVNAQASSLQVLNLHDKRRGSVIVLENNVKANTQKCIAILSAGEESLIRKSDYSDTEECDGIRRRRPISKQSASGREILTTEFSITSALLSNTILLKARASSTGRSLLDDVIKTAVCLRIATGNHGSYNLH